MMVKIEDDGKAWVVPVDVTLAAGLTESMTDEGCLFNVGASYCKIVDDKEDIWRHFSDYDGEGSIPDWCAVKKDGFVIVEFK